MLQQIIFQSRLVQFFAVTFFGLCHDRHPTTLFWWVVFLLEYLCAIYTTRVYYRCCNVLYDWVDDYTVTVCMFIISEIAFQNDFRVLREMLCLHETRREMIIALNVSGSCSSLSCFGDRWTLSVMDVCNNPTRLLHVFHVSQAPPMRDMSHVYDVFNTFIVNGLEDAI